MEDNQVIDPKHFRDILVMTLTAAAVGALDESEAEAQARGSAFTPASAEQFCQFGRTETPVRFQEFERCGTPRPAPPPFNELVSVRPFDGFELPELPGTFDPRLF
jgi:hypothetical protein